MKKRLIYLCIISTLCPLLSFSQTTENELQNTNNQVASDTVQVKKTYYNLRLGADLLSLVKSNVSEDFSGFGLVADFQFSKNYYAAVEIGSVEKYMEEDLFDFTTKGTYIKIGINYNVYENWTGMFNEIYFGLRYGMSFQDQTLHSYTTNAYGAIFEDRITNESKSFDDLNGQWLEFVMGLKVETFKNLYLGAALSVNRIVSTEEPENFKNLYMPGFNRVYSNDLGVGFQYTLSYNIPISKRIR